MRDYSGRFASDEHGNVKVERPNEEFWSAYVRTTLTPVNVPLDFKK